MRRLAPRSARRSNRRTAIMTASAGGALPAAAGGGGSAPDANTLSLIRFNVATPTDIIDSSTGTLVADANCDAVNSDLVLDGTGDWVTFAGATKFDPTANWTLEFHAKIAAAQIGGVVSRDASGAGRFIAFLAGDGSCAFYNDGTLYVSAASMMDDVMRHYAVCRDGGTWRIYKDGVQQASSANAGAPSASAGTVFIGTDLFSAATRDILGRIARVKFSNICRYPNGTTFTPPAKTDG